MGTGLTESPGNMEALGLTDSTPFWLTCAFQGEEKSGFEGTLGTWGVVGV